MTTPTTADEPSGTLLCPACGADRTLEAAFCEACGLDFASSALAPEGAVGQTMPRQAHAPAVTAAAGDESPLDVGWTGPVIGGVAVEVDHPAELTCSACGEGSYVDGYCDQCGSKQPDPRNHFTEAPAAWVAGVCDIGKRHTRNEDAMALQASEAQLGQATIVVCDGVSNTTDSHIASLAAARSARETLSAPIPRGMGTREALISAMSARLGEAVSAARGAVVTATPSADTPAPPSCTFVAAVIDGTLAVVGNVGDSRAYLVRANSLTQISQDHSLVAEQVAMGAMTAQEARDSQHRNIITRALGHRQRVEADFYELTLLPDDRLLLSTDGLHDFVDEEEMRQIMLREEPEAAARTLVARALELGSTDNVSALCAWMAPISVLERPVVEAREPVGASTGRIAVLALIGLIIIIAIAAYVLFLA